MRATALVGMAVAFIIALACVPARAANGVTDHEIRIGASVVLSGPLLPLATETKTVVFGPVTGVSALRQQFNRYMFHVRVGYADEAARIARQLNEIGVTRIATLRQDDAFGNALSAEIRQAAVAQKLQIVAEVSVDTKQPDFARAAAAVAQAQPQAVVMCTAGSTFIGLVKALASTSAHPGVYGYSVVSVDQVTRVLVEGLRRAGRDLSTDSFIRGLESGGEIPFGKFAARYSPQSHSGSSYVELAIIDNEGKLRY